MMKTKHYLFILFISIYGITNSQTVLYSNDFTGGAAGWQLGQGNNFDTWIVNNTYVCASTTPNQGGGNYLHIYDDLGGDYCAHSGFYGSGSGGLVYATMTTGINTMGSTLDSIQFDWLCQGQTGPILASYGSVDYSIDGGISWVNITMPMAQYNGHSAWTHTDITSTQLPAMLNHLDFRLRFGFTNSGYGTNPAFAIDNLKITGNSSSVGISSISSNEDLMIYPNPFSDQLTINMNNNSSSELTIYDVTSRKLIQQYFVNSLVINTDELAKGLYLYEVKTNSRIVRKGKLTK